LSQGPSSAVLLIQSTIARISVWTRSRIVLLKCRNLAEAENARTVISRWNQLRNWKAFSRDHDPANSFIHWTLHRGTAAQLSGDLVDVDVGLLELEGAERGDGRPDSREDVELDSELRCPRRQQRDIQVAEDAVVHGSRRPGIGGAGAHAVGIDHRVADERRVGEGVGA